ncbi:hypothetical protein [Antrihabitans spumae]|jgi:hypothetical protein|uniref:Arsenate reductase n=1 Tax=Antrihabitans spumae TaxID=3373370 RepID=A0ABW7K0Q7_9NOCA
MEIGEVSTEWVPTACTLPTVDQPLRVAEFDALFAQAVSEVSRPEPERLELTIAASDEEWARELSAKESACCSFFSFAFTRTDAGSLLSISVPPAYVDVLDALARRVTLLT